MRTVRYFQTGFRSRSNRRFQPSHIRRRRGRIAPAAHQQDRRLDRSGIVQRPAVEHLDQIRKGAVRTTECRWMMRPGKGIKAGGRFEQGLHHAILANIRRLAGRIAVPARDDVGPGDQAIGAKMAGQSAAVGGIADAVQPHHVLLGKQRRVEHQPADTGDMPARVPACGDRAPGKPDQIDRLNALPPLDFGHRNTDVLDRLPGAGKRRMRGRRRIHHAVPVRRAIPPDIDGIDKAAAARELLHQRVTRKRKIEQRRSERGAVHQQHRRMDRLANGLHLPQAKRRLPVGRLDPQQSFCHHGLTARARLWIAGFAGYSKVYSASSY